MREVKGTLAFAYTAKDAVVILVGHRQPYLFDAGLELDAGIVAGAQVTLTLITVPGPNPANSAKMLFDVERIAALHVDRLPVHGASTLPVRLQLVG